MSCLRVVQVGDRVRIAEDPVVDINLYHKGWTGTVIAIERGFRNPAVEFDPGYTTNEGTNVGLGTPSPGCCRWYVESRCLQILPTGPVDYKQFDEGGVV